MKHLINGKEVNIDWEQMFVIDNHGSGCVDRAIKGIDEDENEYQAQGNYQGDELMEVTEIEEYNI